MPTITSGIEREAATITADVLTMDDARAFVILRLGPDVSITLDGFDHVSATQARAIAEALNNAAAEIEATRPVPDPVEPVAASADPCTHCGGMGFTTHDIIVGGSDHDTEDRECQTCHGTGRAPAEPRPLALEDF